MYWIERNSSLDIDEQKIVKYLDDNNIEYQFFSKKQLIRDKIKLIYGDFIFGSITSIIHSFKKMNIPLTSPINYPKELNGFYHRKIWTENLETAIKNSNINKDYFIKPKNEYKSFTGFLMSNEFGKVNKLLKKYGREYELDCSEEIDFISEFRCYIVDGELKHISNYFGEEMNIEDYNYLEIINSLITNEKFYNTSLDLGITSNNILSVIEHNASFSIDSYDCPYHIYSELLINGWREIYRSN